MGKFWKWVLSACMLLTLTGGALWLCLSIGRLFSTVSMLYGIRCGLLSAGILLGCNLLVNLLW